MVNNNTISNSSKLIGTRRSTVLIPFNKGSLDEVSTLDLAMCAELALLT